MPSALLSTGLKKAPHRTASSVMRGTSRVWGSRDKSEIARFLQLRFENRNLKSQPRQRRKKVASAAKAVVRLEAPHKPRQWRENLSPLTQVMTIVSFISTA